MPPPMMRTGICEVVIVNVVELRMMEDDGAEDGEVASLYEPQEQ